MWLGELPSPLLDSLVSLQRIGFVPKDGFYPLGPFSKRLIKPDEPLDEEEEEEERQIKAARQPMGLPKNILEAAMAAVAVAQQAEQPPEEAAQEQPYDEYYYDQQVGGMNVRLSD